MRLGFRCPQRESDEEEKRSAGGKTSLAHHNFTKALLVCRDSAVEDFSYEVDSVAPLRGPLILRIKEPE